MDKGQVEEKKYAGAGEDGLLDVPLVDESDPDSVSEASLELPSIPKDPPLKGVKGFFSRIAEGVRAIEKLVTPKRQRPLSVQSDEGLTKAVNKAKEAKRVSSPSEARVSPPGPLSVQSGDIIRNPLDRPIPENVAPVAQIASHGAALNGQNGTVALRQNRQATQPVSVALNIAKLAELIAYVRTCNDLQLGEGFPNLETQERKNEFRAFLDSLSQQAAALQSPVEGRSALALRSAVAPSEMVFTVDPVFLEQMRAGDNAVLDAILGVQGMVRVQPGNTNMQQAGRRVPVAHLALEGGVPVVVHLSGPSINNVAPPTYEQLVGPRRTTFEQMPKELGAGVPFIGPQNRPASPVKSPVVMRPASVKPAPQEQHGEPEVQAEAKKQTLLGRILAGLKAIGLMIARGLKAIVAAIGRVFTRKSVAPAENETGVTAKTVAAGASHTEASVSAPVVAHRYHGVETANDIGVAAEPDEGANKPSSLKNS